MTCKTIQLYCTVMCEILMLPVLYADSDFCFDNSIVYIYHLENMGWHLLQNTFFALEFRSFWFIRHRHHRQMFFVLFLDYDIVRCANQKMRLPAISLRFSLFYFDFSPNTLMLLTFQRAFYEYMHAR